MGRVTSKLQVTLPKVIADKYEITPGDEIEWIASGEEIRVVPAKALPPTLTVAERLRLFDEATQRQRERERQSPQPTAAKGESRAYTRDEICDRARAR